MAPARHCQTFEARGSPRAFFVGAGRQGDQAMDEADEFDISVFCLWPPGGAGADPAVVAERDEPRVRRAVGRLFLELKSADRPSPVDEFQMLLNDLTAEMRDQFELFRRLRASAEALISGEDEAAAKAARADAKAATDAMALLVRTLEKIDGLQRQIVRDREATELLAEEEGGDAAIRAELRAIIDAQADARARRLLQSWTAARDGAAVAARDSPGDPGEPESAPGAES